MNKREYVIVIIVSFLAVASLVPLDISLSELHYNILRCSPYIVLVFLIYIKYCRKKNLIKKRIARICIILAWFYLIYSYVFIIFPIMMSM